MHNDTHTSEQFLFLKLRVGLGLGLVFVRFLRLAFGVFFWLSFYHRVGTQPGNGSVGQPFNTLCRVDRVTHESTCQNRYFELYTTQLRLFVPHCTVCGFYDGDRQLKFLARHTVVWLGIGILSLLWRNKFLATLFSYTVWPTAMKFVMITGIGS